MAQGDAKPSLSFKDAIERIGAVIAIVPLVSALLYFVGRTTLDSQYSYFGFESSVLNLSTTEYILQGSVFALIPIGLLFIVLLLLVWMHPMVERRTVAYPPIIRFMSLSGGALFILGAYLYFFPDLLFLLFDQFYNPFLAAALCAALGILLVSYAGYLRRSLAVSSGESDPWAGHSGWRIRTFAVLAVVIALYFVFSAAAIYATQVGRARAEEIQRRIEFRSLVTVCTSNRLEYLAPSIIGGKASGNKYCYSGLRLLAWSDGRYFLITDKGRLPKGTVIVLRDSGDLSLAMFTP